MSDIHSKTYGVPNPHAPKELAQFAFLIGKWQGEGISQNKEGTSEPYQMTWVGRYILNGYAIADEARIFNEMGTVESIFITYRFYDRNMNRWIIEVFNVFESTMTQQAPDDLGGVQVKGDSITLMTRYPNGIGRESFLNRTKDHFTYRLDVSIDEGKSWLEGLDMIEVKRITC